MTNKRKIFLPVLICLFLLCIFSSVLVLNHADEGVKFSYELQGEYSRGITMSLPKAELDGKFLKHKLTYPDGRSTTYEKVTFDKAGEYTVVYFSESADEVGAITKTFIVKDSFSGLFTCSDGVELVGEMDIPDYVNVDGNTVNGAGGDVVEWYGHTSGVKFKANKKGATIDYNGIIDLKALGNSYSSGIDGWWNSIDSSFIEFLVTPEDNTKRELNYLEIILTDIYDPTNYLLMDITATDAGISTSMASCYIATAPKGLYDTVGKPASSLQGEISPKGTTVRSSFYGQVGTVDTDSIRLFYDVNANALWANPTSDKRYPKVVFGNFANPDLVGLENLWYGFTTGEVYLQIRVGSMALQEASFMVLSIGGQSLESNYQAGSEPSEIIVDYGDYQGKELPYGVAGENSTYPVFDAIAINSVGGVLDAPEVSVRYLGEDGTLNEKVVVANNRFKTEKAGKYNICYTSKTVYGKATKIVEVDVLSDYKEQDALSLALSDKILSQAYIGDVIYLYDPITTGGVGTLTIDKKVFYKNGQSLEPIQLDEQGIYPLFKVEKAGEYLLKYTVTDELGGWFVKEMTVKSNYHEKPFIVQPSLLTHAIKGSTITLPKTTANYVDATGEHQAQVKITVDGVDYTNKDYNVIGDFTVKYTATVLDKENLTSEVCYDVKAVDVVNDETFYSHYFIFGDNDNNQEKDFAYEVSTTGVRLTTSTNNASAKFIKDIPVQLLDVKFFTPDTEDCVDRINVYLTDSMNKSQNVKLSVVKVENNGIYYSMFAINDVVISSITGSWEATEKLPFSMSYQNESNGFVDANGKSIGIIENYSNGQAFQGFSSGSVYVEIEAVLKAPKMVTIILQEIAGQAFSSRNNSDKGRPQLVILEDVATSKFVSLGQTFYVPSAFAFDLLSEVESFSCTVITPRMDDQDIIVDKFDGTFSVVAEQVGVYIISFAIKDASNNKLPTQNGEFYVTVEENNAPTVSVTDLKTQYKVGDKFKLPTITVTDDITEQPVVVTYLQNPNYKMITSLNDYKFTMAGRYILCVYATDEFSNFTLEQIEIFVTE